MSSNAIPVQQSYWEQYKSYLPNNIASTAFLSAALNFSIVTFITENPAMGAFDGGLCALATLVDAAVKPILRMVFGEVIKPKSPVEIFIRTTIVISSISLLAPVVGVPVSLATNIFWQVIWEAVQCDDSNNATVYI